MPFQTQVNVQPAPGLAGDFADENPRYTVDAGPGALVAGAQGLIIGRFAWWDTANQQLVNNTGTGQVTGFVAREFQALITTYLAEAGLTIPAGFPVTLFSGGGFWVVNSGANEVVVGQKAYANYSNGLATFAATASPTTGASGTTSTIAPATSSVTGSITGNVLTVTTVGSGTIYPGTTLSGTGVTTGTQVVSQISGTTGGVGTYYVSIQDQAAASTTISGTYGLFTAAGTITGTFGVGDILSGTSVTAGTVITAIITGSGGAGTYAVSPSGTTSSTTISATANIETKWIAMSAGPAGGIIKISDRALG